jgi:8-oxo-dGTP diphosphatase
MTTFSHPEARALGWQQFGDWVAEVNIPVFALGGIRKQDFANCPSNHSLR